MDTSEQIHHLQERLVRRYHDKFPDLPLSDATKRAFYANPRHLFISKYREPEKTEWNEISPANLPMHLDKCYDDNPVILAGEYNENVSSTISQPTLVLYMLELLQLKPGQHVLELGTGSGWSAALTSSIIGPTGKVTTFEIIPDLIEPARAALKSLGHDNVTVIQGDGGGGAPADAPFDRIVFTAGTFDVPKSLYNQIKPNGLFLCVLKIQGTNDQLILFKKMEEHFEALFFTPCSFVPLTGKYEIKNEEGNEHAIHDFKKKIFNKAFSLKIYPADMDLAIEPQDMLVRKKESQFLWTVKQPKVSDLQTEFG